jgi:hypothetical protein
MDEARRIAANIAKLPDFLNPYAHDTAPKPEVSLWCDIVPFVPYDGTYALGACWPFITDERKHHESENLHIRSCASC